MIRMPPTLASSGYILSFYQACIYICIYIFRVCVYIRSTVSDSFATILVLAASKSVTTGLLSLGRRMKTVSRRADIVGCIGRTASCQDNTTPTHLHVLLVRPDGCRRLRRFGAPAPDVLRPGIVGMPESMVIRLRPCMT